MLADAKAGRFKTLIVRDYARLSRNHNLTRQIEQTLAQCGITILTPNAIPSISPF
jgi:DNA invertase Pin-like site-specific DNA recombinase